MKIKLNGQEVELLIGMDAEFFIRNDKGFIAAARVIPGLKHQPFKLDNGVCHPDGLSLEVGAPPSTTPEGMIVNLFKVLAEVKEKYLDPAGCSIAYQHYVNTGSVQGVQSEDLQFGCGREFDAYYINMIKQVGNSYPNYRFSGFHIHLGFGSGFEENNLNFRDLGRLVKSLDSAFFQAGLGTSRGRANSYGGYGAFRIKPYGIEYRMLDCEVITDTNKLNQMLGVLNKLPEIFEKACNYYQAGSTERPSQMLEKAVRYV